MPDFTLVTTHVGAIEVGGQVVGLARFATVNWRYTCRFGPRTARTDEHESESEPDSEAESDSKAD